MADDWVRMRPALLRHPKVIRMAAVLSQDPRFTDWVLGAQCDPDDCASFESCRAIVIAGLLGVWGVANERSDEGFIDGIMLGAIDELAGIPGFGKAMADVQWAVEDDRGVYLPKFTKWNSPRKTRSSSSGAERQRAYRERKAAKGRNGCDVTVTSPVTSLSLSASASTSGSSSSSPDGEEGQNGRELSSCERQELSMDAELRKLVDAVHKVVKGKHSTVMDVVLGWREPRELTWEAWQAHIRKVGSDKGRVDIHSGYEHPDVMAEDIPAPSWQEREQDAFMRKTMDLLKKGTH